MTKYHFIARGSLAVELNNAIHVMVFDNPEFGQVRTILNERGNRFSVVRMFAMRLGIADPIRLYISTLTNMMQ